MDQQKILDLLDSLDFGQDAAENENNLKDVFIEGVDVYEKLINDEIDVVTGSKGSGKSAIYRMITESEIADDLFVTSAVNPTGSPVFRVLFTENDSEDRLRGIWTAYITSLIGNWVVDNYEGNLAVQEDVEEVKEILQLLGLRKKPAEKKSLLRRIRSATSMQASAGGSLAGNFNVGLKFDLPGEQSNSSQVVLGAEDFHSVIKKSTEILEIKNIRLWVAFDRLDECFTRDSPIERRALRALLRTHLDVAQHLNYRPTVRLKIFLRRDLMSRMSTDAIFTNSTHLRQADLRWNSASIARLVSRRAMQSQLFRETLISNVPVNNIIPTVWRNLLPELKLKNDRGGKPMNAHRQTVEFICRNTADGNRGFNPRNVISLFAMATSRASEHQRQAIRDDRAHRSVTPLIQFNELHSAEGDLSRKRLQDTVENEFQMVTKYVRRLEGGPAEFSSIWELMRVIGREGVPLDKAEEIANELCLSGVIAANGQSYRIPYLYRAALRPVVKKSSKHAGPAVSSSHRGTGQR